MGRGYTAAAKTLCRVRSASIRLSRHEGD